MAHAKQQIRDQCVVQTTGLGVTGSRVFTERVYPHGDDKLPGLNWRTGDEELVKESETIGRRQRWELELLCEGRAKPAAGEPALDELLDTIQAEVQAAILADPTLGGRVIYTELRRAEKRSTGKLERPTGIVEMTFVCRYWIHAADPQTLLYV